METFILCFITMVIGWILASYSNKKPTAPTQLKPQGKESGTDERNKNGTDEQQNKK